MDQLLRINMTDQTAAFQPLPAKYEGRAGRWLTSSIVHDEVPATCHPLGPNNKLVFSPGIVTGTSSPTSARISVGGKSPLTGGIKEANAGTGWGRRLARLGIRAVIVEGQAEGLWLVKIDASGVTFEPAEDWSDLKLSEVYPTVFDRFGGMSAVDVCSIGVAGEHRMAAAGICFNDQEGRPSRYAGRGGLGAVMGSKGLKFLVVDDAAADDVPIADPETFERGRKKMARR